MWHFYPPRKVRTQVSTHPAIWPNWNFYSDLTGKFPVQSDKGNNYILVAYHYDTNNIPTTPFKNRTGTCIINGITKIHKKLRKWGLTPKLHIMDNEVSEIFPNLHSSLISILKLCDDECIFTFEKHKVIVIKNNDVIIEGYRDPKNGLWRFPLHHPAQNNKQANMM